MLKWCFSVAAGNGKCLAFWAQHLLSVINHWHVIYVIWEKLLLDFFFCCLITHFTVRNISSHFSDLISSRWGAPNTQPTWNRAIHDISFKTPHPKRFWSTTLLLWSHNNRKPKQNMTRFKQISTQCSSTIDNFCSHCTRIIHSVLFLFRFSWYYDSNQNHNGLKFSIFQPQVNTED